MWFGPDLPTQSAAGDRSRTINRAGFRRKAAGGEGWEYLILPGAWGCEVCKGLNPKRAGELLARLGFLLGTTGRNRTAPVTIPGEGKMRVYRVSGAIMAGDDAEGGSDGAC